MFNNVMINYDSKNDVYSVTGFFGNNFRNRSIRKLGIQKIDALFIKFGLIGFSFYGFFIPEVIYVLENVIISDSVYGVNIKALRAFLVKIKELSKYDTVEPLDTSVINEKMHYKILEDQQAAFDKYEINKSKLHYRGLLFDMGTGTGKALRDDTPVRVPGGWKPIGSLIKGETVIGNDGKPTKVLSVHPQGIVCLYTVRFEDGREIVSCGDHLWKIYPEMDTFVNQGHYEIMSTMDLIDFLAINGNKASIDLITPEKIDSISLPEDPYFLATTDWYIPNEYKNGSVLQRWSLLQGIFDKANITVNEEGEFIFTSYSEILVKDLQSIIFSLGGVAKINNKKRLCVLKFKHPEAYKFFTSNAHMDLINTIEPIKTKMLLGIESIVKTKSDYATCIAVDNVDHLFVVDNYITTHNTFTALAISECVNTEVAICIIPNNSVDNVWIKGLTTEIYKKPQSYYNVKNETGYKNEKFILSNYESIEKLFDILPEISGKKITVIIDEIHNFLDAKSNRTVALLKLLDLINTEDIILLSGTPIKSGVAELAVLISMLDLRFRGAVVKRFLALYRNPGNVFKETLRMRYGDFSVRVSKDNVGPKPIVRNIPMVLDNGVDYTLPVIATNLKIFITRRMEELEKQAELYAKLYTSLYEKAKAIQLKNKVDPKFFNTYEKNIRDIVNGYKRKQLMFMSQTIKDANVFENKYLLPVLQGDEKKLFKEAKTIYKYPSLKVQGEALAGVIGKARIECHRDMAYHFDFTEIIESTEKKTLIFSSYIDVCDAALKNVRNEGYSPVSVYGENVKHLTQTVKLFTENENVNPLIATYKSLGESVPVVAANIVIILDTPFRMYIYDQAIARVWRRGQDKQTYVYIPLLDTGEVPNINSRNIDIIAFFKDEVEKITGYSSDVDIINEADMNVSTEDYKEIPPTIQYGRIGLEELMKSW